MCDEKKVYCLFCLAGYEKTIASYLDNKDVEHMVAYSNRIVNRNGVNAMEVRNLLPGYIFIETDELSVDEMNQIRVMPHVVRFLRYAMNEYALKGDDLKFYRWMKAHNGVIDVSRVYKVGDRIKVIDGVLKEYEGSIVKVNMKRRCVAIQLSENSILRKIWCSIDVVEYA